MCESVCVFPVAVNWHKLEKNIIYGNTSPGICFWKSTHEGILARLIGQWFPCIFSRALSSVFQRDGKQVRQIEVTFSQQLYYSILVSQNSSFSHTKLLSILTHTQISFSKIFQGLIKGSQAKLSSCWFPLWPFFAAPWAGGRRPHLEPRTKDTVPTEGGVGWHHFQSLNFSFPKVRNCSGWDIILFGGTCLCRNTTCSPFKGQSWHQRTAFYSFLTVKSGFSGCKTIYLTIVFLPPSQQVEGVACFYRPLGLIKKKNHRLNRHSLGGSWSLHWKASSVWLRVVPPSRFLCV